MPEHRRHRFRLPRTLTLILLLGASVTAAAEEINWATPVAFPGNLSPLGTPAQYLAERLQRMSAGALTLNLQEPEADIPADSILEAVAEGRVDAGYTWLGYDHNRRPAASLFAAVPFGLKPWAFMAWYYEGPGHKMLQQLYADAGLDVHARLCGLAGPESAGWYRQSIDSAEDFRDMDIRFGGLGGEVLRSLGASISVMAPTELAAAVEDGRLQATEFSMPSVDRHAGLAELFSHNLFPGWHQPFTAQYLVINGKHWRRASQRQQSLIATACTAATARSLAESEYRQGQAVAALRESGATLERLPQPVLDELRRASTEVLQARAERDPQFRRIYESQQAFQADYRRWEELAY